MTSIFDFIFNFSNLERKNIGNLCVDTEPLERHFCTPFKGSFLYFILRVQLCPLKYRFDV